MKPNILLITSDEHRFDAVGINGNPYLKTPHLDQLAREGINFLNHTCSSPVCTPARASILTGQYPRTHGAWNVGYALDPNKPGLAQWLAAEGYTCGLFGKSHFEPELSLFAEHMDYTKPYYGFQYFSITEDHPAGEYLNWIRGMHPGLLEGVMKTCHEESQHPPIPMRESEKFKAVYTSPIPEEAHQTAWISDRTIDFIQQRGGNSEPFFAWCSFVDPHHPWIPPEPFASMYDPEDMPPPKISEGETEGLRPGYNFPERMPPGEYQRMCAAYYAMISHIDHHIGRIVRTLKELGMYDNTIIIYTSDHGDYNGDHGLIRKSPWLFDNVLRVPMIVKCPGGEHIGIRFDGNTQHEDIAPTLLEFIGSAVPNTIQGMSFASVLHEGKGSSRAYSFFDLMGKVGIQKGDYKLLFYPKASWPAVPKDFSPSPNEGFKLLAYPDPSDGFILTNVREDPLEYANLSGFALYADMEQELKTELFRWLLNTPQYYPARKYAW